MKIGIVSNGTSTQAMDAALQLQEYLAQRGITAVQADGYEPSGGDCDPRLRDCDLVMSLGGDGTTLKAARLLGYSQIPLMSINFGNLGFLSSGAKEGDMFQALDTFLAGDYSISSRATLLATLVFDDGVRSSFFALNEVLLNRGHQGRILDFQLSINDNPMMVVRGDGMITASATGSTAYALSAGGPIVAPGHKGMILVPLAPHTLQSRAIVTGPDDQVRIDVLPGTGADIDVLIDGVPVAHELFDQRRLLRVELRRGPGDVHLVQLGRSNFYQTTAKVFFPKA